MRQARDIALAMGAKEEFIEQNAAVQREIFRILLSDRSAAEANEAVQKVADAQLLALSADQRKALGEAHSPFRMTQSPWFREVLRVDPREALRSVKCPVFALTGEKDLQVAAKENLSAIQVALSEGGNRRVTTKQLPGLNHLFQTARSGVPGEYAEIQETFSPNALKEISEWILDAMAAAGAEASRPPTGG